MAEIFGKQLDEIDYKDTEKAIYIIEQHIIYLQETLDYILGQLKKEVTSNGL